MTEMKKCGQGFHIGLRPAWIPGCSMRFDVLTIFPQLLESPLQEGIIRRALKDGVIEVGIHDIRGFTADKHKMTDDRPFGGGEGMVMKPEPLAAAVNSVRLRHPGGRVILLSPQGRTYDQEIAAELAAEEHLILVCGRYEGIDQRFTDRYVDDEISIGDYILTGGELAALVLIDSVTRLIPGVLGCADSASQETFSCGLLKFPQYTRPRLFEEIEVPPVLLNGDHQAIADWRFIASVNRTLARRPELLATIVLSKREIKLLRQHGLLAAVESCRSGSGRDG